MFVRFTLSLTPSTRTTIGGDAEENQLSWARTGGSAAIRSRINMNRIERLITYMGQVIKNFP